MEGGGTQGTRSVAAEVEVEVEEEEEEDVALPPEVLLDIGNGALTVLDEEDDATPAAAVDALRRGGALFSMSLMGSGEGFVGVAAERVSPATTAAAAAA